MTETLSLWYTLRKNDVYDIDFCKQFEGVITKLYT